MADNSTCDMHWQIQQKRNLQFTCDNKQQPASTLALRATVAHENKDDSTVALCIWAHGHKQVAAFQFLSSWPTMQHSQHNYPKWNCHTPVSALWDNDRSCFQQFVQSHW